MSLKRIERRRCPHDRWFRTEANLSSIMRAMSNYDDDMTWPKPINETTVPIWVRMERYEAQKTKRRPDGMTWGPAIKIGSQNSPEVVMHGYHHSCGLFYDYHIDGYDASEDGKWLYYPLTSDCPGWGEDVSVYHCDKCGNHLYRDDFGLREDNLSACLMDGGLVCRLCEWHGMIAASEVQKRMGLCRLLATYVGKDCTRSLNRGFEMFARKVSPGGKPLQTRVWLDCKWSFSWSTLAFDEGEWKRYMHGGLILHGPTPTKNDDNTYSFETWDYGEKKTRPATAAEVAAMCWSIHT